MDVDVPAIVANVDATTADVVGPVDVVAVVAGLPLCPSSCPNQG